MVEELQHESVVLTKDGSICVQGAVVLKGLLMFLGACHQWSKHGIRKVRLAIRAWLNMCVRTYNAGGGRKQTTHNEQWTEFAMKSRKANSGDITIPQRETGR